MSLTISAIEIENIGCIASQRIEPGVLTIIEGRNATGKTTILNALRYSIETGHDPSLLTKGREEGSIKVTLSDGVTITTTITQDKTTRIVRHPQFGKISKTTEWMKSIINSVSFDPASFLTAKPADRLAIFLKSLPIKLTTEQLLFVPMQFVKETDLSKHPLEVIGSKTSGLYGAAYKERTEINRLVKDKRSTVAEMERGLPPAPEEGDWGEVYQQKSEELGALRLSAQGKTAEIRSDYKSIEDAAARIFNETDVLLEKELAEQIGIRRIEFEEAVEKLRADTEIARRHALEVRDTQIREAAHNRDESIAYEKAQYDPKNQALIAEISQAQTMIDQHAKAQASRDLIARLNTEATQYEEKSDHLTEVLKKLEALKASLVETLPIKGMEIADGKLLVDGIEFDRLNDAEKHRIAVEIMRLNHGDLGLMVLDRAEIFDSKSWALFKAACKKAGLPIFATRVTDSDLTVITEGKESAA